MTRATAAIDSIDYALQHSWADLMLANYRSAVDCFLAFCTAQGVPQKFQLPADEFVLCAFAASSAGIHSGSTARNNIAAVKTWHIAQKAQWNGGSRLHYVLAGVDNLGLDFLESLRRGRICRGLCRLLGAVPTWGNTTHFLFIHISRSSRNNRSTTLRLPRTKTKINGEDVVLVSQSNPINPRIALDMHLLANRCDNHSPLFAYSGATGPTILTKPKFLERCNEIWQAAGSTGHSFRIGGTTELLFAGVSPDVVKAMGRLSSDAFRRYWRSLEDLAPIHAEFIRVP
ncbi:hypothetical protein DFH07DRAFT_1025064 [Mycena maculata]|uniref:Uncharacterized protein n=1 Tax=Mycena maculata TaxID=230809 RepID=A0AAD7NFX2_9AGAR|nr:hypothetical protein DFH07DRAFT_1025064 [Mycena maculata]